MTTHHDAHPTADRKLPEALPITPLSGPIDIEIAVPGSKSITNRALLCGALADGPVTLTGALLADDTVYMLKALEELGFEVVHRPDEKIMSVRGQSGEIPRKGAELFLGNAGTATRFLTSMVCLGEGRFVLDGNERMRQRPINDLVSALQGIEVDIRCLGEGGCPPVEIQARGMPGGRAQIDGSKSSQYISGLLMVAPYAENSLSVEVTGDFVSRPYVELTLQIMADFGVGVNSQGLRIYTPNHGMKYRSGEYDIEGDATAASYFLAAAAICGGRAVVTNVRADSAQGDVGFAQTLARMGCRVRHGFLAGGRGIEVYRDPATPLEPVHVDLNDMPDIAQTLAAVCLFAEGTSTIINVANLRIKETDRLSALAKELSKLGAEIEEGADYLEITPGPHKEAAVETYDDHRMAMAMALIGLGRSGVTILKPACVAKTYPHYFNDLERLRG